MKLDADTFVDPNGDNLTYVSRALPSWLEFNPSKLAFNGTPTEYGTYNVSVTARDGWNASATLNFEIVAGIRPNLPPVILKNLTN